MTKPCSRVALSAALFSIAIVAPAAAVAAAKRVGVPKFDGAQEALVRKQVMQVLKAHGYEVAKSREMEAAVSNTGALLESDDGFQKVAKELALMAIVTGEVGKKRAKIIIHDGREGSVLGEGSFPGANPKKIAAEVGKSFWKQLGADVERGHTPSGSKKPKAPVAEAPEDDENAPEAGGDAPPPPEPEPKSKRSKESKADIVADGPREGEPEPEAAPKKKKKKKKRSDSDTGEEDEGGGGLVPATIDLAAGMAGINRGYAYNQDVTGLRPYNLPLGAAAVLRAVAYPLVYVTDGPLQHLGAELTIEQAFGIASSIGPGMDPLANSSYATSVHEYSGGVRYRFPFGVSGHHFWASLTAGEHAFVFKSTATGDRSQLDIPDTIYQFVRPGVGVRFELHDFAIGASAGYRLIMNRAGTQIIDPRFFPHLTVGGFDADVYLGYRFTEMIEARVNIQFRRYFFDMNSQATDMRRAGGAIDQYISGGVGVAFLFGGSERLAPAEPEEEPAPKKKKKKKAAEDEEAAEEE
jgi:hypothetical protein